MSTYKLQITIDSASAKSIAATKQQIALVKSMTEGTTVHYPILWFAIPVASPSTSDPLIQAVTWEPSYIVYQTPDATYDLKPGEKLQPKAKGTTPAVLGQTVTFENGTFDKGQPGVPEYYGILNLQGDHPNQVETFGLLQNATVTTPPDATVPTIQITDAPMCATTVLTHQTLLLEPKESVYVFLMLPPQSTPTVAVTSPSAPTHTDTPSSNNSHDGSITTTNPTPPATANTTNDHTTNPTPPATANTPASGNDNQDYGQGTLIASIPPNALHIQLTEVHTVATIAYDPMTSSFYQIS